MLFASIGESFFWSMMLLGSCLWLICWRAKKIAKDYDKDGKIKSAATGGIIRIIERFLK